MTDHDTSSRQYPDSVSTHFDPLLTSLVILTRLHGCPIVEETLIAGLPLENNRLTLPLFIRASQQAGFSARIIRRRINQLSDLIAPCILLLKNDRCCVLTSINHNSGYAEIILPEASEGGSGSEEAKDGFIRMSIKALIDEYDDHIIACTPELKFDERAETTVQLQQEHWFWGTLLMSWRIYRDVLIASILINLFILVNPFFIRNIYDRVVPNNAIDTMWAFAIGALIIFTFDIVLRIMRSYFIDLAGKKSDLQLSAMLFGQVLGMRFDSKPASTGSFAKNVQEYEVVRDFITSATLSTLVDLPFVLLFLAAIAMLSGVLVWVPATAIIVSMLCGLALHPLIRGAVEKTYKAGSLKNGLLIESIGGLESIKATGSEGQTQRKWEQAVSFIADWSIKSRLYSNTAGSIGTYINQLATIFLVIGGVYLIQSGELTMGGLIAAVMLSSRAINPTINMANLATRFHSARTAYYSLVKVMGLPQERPPQKKFLYHPHVKGDIKFKEVSFSYPQARHMALADVSFNIEAKQRVGIIGRLGSGKSTVTKLLLSLYQPTKGSIKIDGIDLAQLDPVALRKNIGIVIQDQVLFYGTLRENIVMGCSHAEDSTIIKAAELAGVMEFAGQHPDGLDLNVGERGQLLSGGQRQCILLARALLLDPPVLVLDEPTSNMDAGSEARFIQRLSSVLNDKTLLLATHKSSLLELTTHLILMDNGQVAATGTRQEVIEKLRAQQLQETSHVPQEAPPSTQSGYDTRYN